jgi:hypothetical protein
MHHRLLSLLVALVFSSPAIAAKVQDFNPFEHSALGKCFDGADSFIRKTLGESAPSDQNIIKSTKGSWTWIVDQTATKNYTWYLLQSRDSQICLRVFVPAASHVEFRKPLSHSQVNAFVAPEAGFPAKLIELTPRPDARSFHASRCYILKGSAPLKITKRRLIPCESLYD